MKILWNILGFPWNTQRFKQESYFFTLSNTDSSFSVRIFITDRNFSISSNDFTLIN